jgi:hypothetical protein
MGNQTQNQNSTKDNFEKIQLNQIFENRIEWCYNHGLSLTCK